MGSSSFVRRERVGFVVFSCCFFPFFVVELWEVGVCYFYTFMHVSDVESVSKGECFSVDLFSSGDVDCFGVDSEDGE